MEANKIIITGGATRIGAAIAKKLSGPNKEILIHYNKSKSKAETLKKDLEKNGTKIYLAKGDLSKETDRRRAMQVAYNKKHNIDATSIKKEISDVLESVYEKDYLKVGTGDNIGGNLKKHLKQLNKRMKDSATNLEFEEAAKIRDEIRNLEASELEIVLNPKVKHYNQENRVYPKGRSKMGLPGTRAQKGKKKWKQTK